MCWVEQLVVSVSNMYLDPTKHDGDIINRKVTDVYDNNKKYLWYTVEIANHYTTDAVLPVEEMGVGS
jgi:hypothetical protein